MVGMTKMFAVTHGCVFCGTCILICPVQAIVMDKNGARIDPEKCQGCGQCAENCASEAIQPVGKKGPE